MKKREIKEIITNRIQEMFDDLEKLISINEYEEIAMFYCPIVEKYADMVENTNSKQELKAISVLTKDLMLTIARLRIFAMSK